MISTISWRYDLIHTLNLQNLFYNDISLFNVVDPLWAKDFSIERSTI